jgi:hypothetical protein
MGATADDAHDRSHTVPRLGGLANRTTSSTLGAPMPSLRRPAASLLVVTALALGIAGCSPRRPVVKGIELYQEGEFVDAADTLTDAELSYANGSLSPEFELKYLAYRGLAHHKAGKITGDKAHGRKARPLVRRALDRWSKIPEAKSEKWLDEAIVKELETAAGASAGAAGAPDEE